MSNGSSPPPTRPPGPGLKSYEAPIPPYVVQRATEAYQEGYARGFNDGADAYLKLEAEGRTMVVDRDTQESVYRAPEARAWNDIPGVGHAYADFGESIYKWGYIDGWEASVMSYIRSRRGR